MMKRPLFLKPGCFALAVLLLASCNTTPQPAKPRIALVMKSLANEFFRQAIFILTACLLCSSLKHAGVAQARAPNIVVILADDLGYSDLSCYGGEIQTPNLDGLAKNGLRFTQFYNSARCCPTRAALLTGLYPHQAGVGMMTADAGENYPGYRGAIQPYTVTLAEVLKATGYRTAPIRPGILSTPTAAPIWPDE